MALKVLGGSRTRDFATHARVLCSVRELKALHGDALKFALDEDAPPDASARARRRKGATGFVFFCATTQVPRAYLNQCPHARLELDLNDSDFFCDGFIQCKAHGAFFDPQTGMCLQGPAAARRGRLRKQLGALPELAVAIDGDNVVLVERKRDVPIVQQRDVEALNAYRAQRQYDLSVVLARRQDDVQAMHNMLHEKAAVRMRQYSAVNAIPMGKAGRMPQRDEKPPEDS